METQEKTGRTGLARYLSQLRAKIEGDREETRYEQDIEDITRDISSTLKRKVRAAMEANTKEQKMAELDDALAKLDVLNSMLGLGPAEELSLDIATSTHIMTVEAQPISAFREKKDMGYAAFQAKYPSFVKWIETNGWTYSEEKDQHRSPEPANSPEVQSGT